MAAKERRRRDRRRTLFDLSDGKGSGARGHRGYRNDVTQNQALRQRGQTNRRDAVLFEKHGGAAVSIGRTMQVICTAADPWNGKSLKGVQVAHADAVELRQRDGYPGGDLVDFECPNCMHKWTMELPQ